MTAGPSRYGLCRETSAAASLAGEASAVASRSTPRERPLISVAAIKRSSGRYAVAAKKSRQRPLGSRRWSSSNYPANVLKLAGELRLQIPGEPGAREQRVVGTLEFIRPPGTNGAKTQARPRVESFLRYALGPDGTSGIALSGYKRIRGEMNMDGWRDVTTLFVRVRGIRDPGGAVDGAGCVHVDFNRFLFNQIPSMEITGTDDPARIAWATARFAAFFFGWLWPDSGASVHEMMERVGAIGLRPNAQRVRSAALEAHP